MPLDTLARRLGERVARFGRTTAAPDIPPGLLVNLSHILHDAPSAPEVISVANRAWAASSGPAVDPRGIWTRSACERVGVDNGFVLVAPAGPPLLTAGIDLLEIMADAGGPNVTFFGSPARLATATAASAITSGRPLWFAWLVRTPGGWDGALAPLEMSVNSRDTPSAIAAATARACEPVLRSFPRQCRAFAPFWDCPFDAASVPSVGPPDPPNRERQRSIQPLQSTGSG